jgi:type II secretory ATPase GspE/PulE/Tfp pilus assembly ATPase PilB-like protein
MLREVSFTDKKVVTLEDFVTFRREGFVQMEYSSLGHGNDCDVLKMALGQNPDVFMLTSDLSRESIRMLFNVALTGKLILIALPFQNVYTCFCYLKSLGIEPFP